MPTLEDLAQFKQTLAEVGGETAILAARGEEAEEPLLPAGKAEAGAEPNVDAATPVATSDTTVGRGAEAVGPVGVDLGLGELDTDDLLGSGDDQTDDATDPAKDNDEGGDLGDLTTLFDTNEDAPPLPDPVALPADQEADDFDLDSFATRDDGADATDVVDDFDLQSFVEPGEPDAADATGAEDDFELPAGDPPEASEAAATDDLGEFDLDSLDLSDAADAVSAGTGDGDDLDSFDLGDADTAVVADVPGEAVDASDARDDAPESDQDLFEPANAAQPDEPEAAADFDPDALETLDADASASAKPDAEGEIAFDLDGTDDATGDEDAEELSEEIAVDSLDEFALPEVGDEFGDLGDVVAESEATAEPPPAPAADASGDATYQISEQAFDELKINLAQLPVDLRLAVEDLVASATAAVRVRRVLDLLAGGAPVAQLAAEVRRVTGKPIEIPRQLERRTGRELEAELGSLAYRLRRRLVPLLLTVLVVAVGGSGVALLGYRLLFLPLRAQSLYRDGYEMIALERYPEAKDTFNQAVAARPVRRWHHRYAERFVEQRAPLLAADFYEQTLVRWPDDVPAHIALAQLQTKEFGDYASAERNLRCVLEGAPFDPGRGEQPAGKDATRMCVLKADIYHFDALLAHADNYLAWSRTEPTQLEEARFHYALAIREHGDRDEAIYGMLRYLVRTRNERDARILGELLQQRDAAVSAAAFTQLGAFLLDERTVDGVQAYLFDALEVVPTDPEVHFQISRYFRAAGDPGEELRALRTAVNNFGHEGVVVAGGTAPVDLLEVQDRVAHRIQAHNRWGELLYDRNEILDAEAQFSQAISLLNSALDNEILNPVAPAFGDVFANMGDIHFFVTANRVMAKEMYQRAEQIYDRTPPSVDYKLAFLSYSDGDYLEALRRLTRLDQALPANENLLFALGNAFYSRGDYFVAQGYYLRLLNMLETRHDRIPVLRIREDADHHALVDDLMKAYNNLGVTLKELADLQARDTAKLSQALANLTQSHELYDLLNRESDTLVATEAANLAFLNTRGILNPLADFEPQIYRRLTRDLRSGSL